MLSVRFDYNTPIRDNIIILPMTAMYATSNFERLWIKIKPKKKEKITEIS